MISAVIAIMLITSSDEVKGAYESFSDKDRISVGKQTGKAEGTPFHHGGKRITSGKRNVSISPNPCWDTGSAQVVLGGCAGPDVCQDDTRMGSTVFTAHERQYVDSENTSGRSFSNLEFCQDSPTARRNRVPLRALVAEEWRQIQLPTPVIEVQPADQRTLVNLDTYTQAPQEEFHHTTTLLGQEVNIRANAVMWHWDLGDGSDVISEDHPGTAFPEPTGYFHYRQPGNYTITLTVEWEAQFTTDEQTWQTIPGTGQTTATLDIEVGEHRPRLQYNP